MKITFYIIIAIGFFFGCHTPPESKNKIDYTQIPNQSVFSKQKSQDLVLDTIRIYAANENQLTSLEGIYYVLQDTLYFADQQLAGIFLYDLEGNFIKTYLSRGRGPKEILGLNTFTPLQENGFAIMDEQWNIFLLDRSWNPIKKYQIDWQSQKTPKSLYFSPDPNESGMYEVEYAANNLRPLGNDWLIFPIVTEHIRYNGYEGTNTRNFYKNSYTLGLIDIKNGHLKKMMCNRSPIYNQYQYLPNFKNVIFETNHDILYYTFEIDSLIYRMNFRDSSIVSFGYQGRYMNTRYTETTSFVEADSTYRSNHERFGYYYHLKYIPETEVLFRSIHYGTPQTKDGIQCYKNHVFIGEYKVPQGFQVIGYHPPYYYAAGTPNSEKEEMLIYKFKLDK